MRTEVRLAGTGGQGLVKASAVLAYGLGMEASYDVIQTQFYSGQISGGPSSGDVVISDEKVEYPWVLAPDLLVAMSQPAVYAHAPHLKPGAKILVDDIMVTDVGGVPPEAEIYWAPFTRLGDEAGFRKSANMAALGIVAQVTGLLTLEQIEAAVMALAPGNKKINLQAVRAGFEVKLAKHVRKAGDSTEFEAQAFRGV